MPETYRILIVEDVETDAELAVRELKRAGLKCSARRVDTEEEFRRELAAFQPHAILSDFSMPHFDGMGALAIVRESCPDVPFIFVSGTIGEEYAIRALKNGAVDYVLKNNLVRLPVAVERAIEENRERSARRKAEADLEETRTRLHSIMSELRDVIWSVDIASGQMLYVSPAIESICKRPAAEFHQNPGLWLEMIHPDDRLRVKSEWEAARHDRVFESRYRIILPGGGMRWIHNRAHDVTDPVANVIRRDGIARDITELHENEERIAYLSRIRAVLSGINSAIVRIRDRQELFNEACRIAVEHGTFAMAWIGMLDRATLDVRPVAWAGVDAEHFARLASTARSDVPEGQGVMGQAMRAKRPVFINDITADSRAGGQRRREALQRGYRSLIALPLLVDGEVIGNFSLYAREANFFNEDEVKLLTELAGDIAFGLQYITKEEKVIHLNRIYAVLSGINSTIVRVRDRQELFNEACRIAVDHGGFGIAWIGTFDPEKLEITPVASAGLEGIQELQDSRLMVRTSVPQGRGLAAQVIQERKPVFSNDITAEPAVGGERRKEAIRRGYRSTIALPLMEQGNVVGIFSLFAKEADFFDDEELKLLAELAGDISYALEHIGKEEKLNYLAYYDALTGLPNRALFLERLSQHLRVAEQNGTRVALLLGDVKRLRFINESLGRHAGDALLRELAARIRKFWPNPDSVARIAADCFAAILPDPKDAAEIAHVLEKQVTQELSLPFRVEDKDLAIAMVVGIAVFPGDGRDADTLFRNVEAALNEAKALGERYLFYQPEMNARVAETLILENKLRRALEKQQFVLHYQPKSSLAAGSISGLEALIRWNDPDGGLMPPAQFIPLLEETGLILDVGRWAIRKALADHREWESQGLQPPRIAVNVSAIQLRQKDFVEAVRTAVAEFPAAGLDLEITESLLMEDIEDNIEKLRAIRELGIRIVIDDFGTGYSSLAYLAKLPVNALKIDRSFVITMGTSPDSMAIVSTMISLAHSLNLKVIAEGVETEEQLKFLKLLKCDEIQGYLFSKPLPADELVRLLRESHRNT